MAGHADHGFHLHIPPSSDLLEDFLMGQEQASWKKLGTHMEDTKNIHFLSTIYGGHEAMSLGP